MRQKLLAFTLTLSILAGACGGTADEPTATPAPAKPTEPPPTATVPPPTATPIPPTATPAPAPQTETSSGVPQALNDAIVKTRDAKNYAAKIVFSGKGAVMDIPGEIPEDKEAVLMELSAKFAGENSSTQFGGLLANMLGSEASEASVEYLTLDGKTYIKGPAALLGAPEAIWYVVPEDRAGTIKPPLQAGDLFKDMTVEGDDLKSFKSPVTEEMDGQSCQVYKANQEDMTKSNDSFSEAFSEIELAEGRLAVCADGYVHELSIAFGGKLKKDPTKSGQISVVMRLTDFDKSFAFEAPKDPAPLQAPGGMLPAPGTPEAENTITGDPAATSDYPKPDDAKNVITAGEGVMILETALSLKEAIAFYREALAAQGLEENKQLTVESDSVFSLVMSGLPDGKAVVVQGVKVAEGKTTLSIRTEAQ